MRFIQTVLIATSLACAAHAQTVTVRPFDHRQTFLGGGGATGLYSGHLVNGTNAALAELAYDWLYTDLENPFVRGSFNDHSEPVNDNNDPYVFDVTNFVVTNQNEGVMAREATERNPRTRVMVYAEDIPLWLRIVNGNGDYELDYSNPDLFPEIAEWLFGNMYVMKQFHGVDIDCIDLLNEPDLGSSSFKHNKTDGANLLENVPPLLQALIDSPQNIWDLQMPKFSYASNLTPGGMRNWISDIRSNHPAAWANVDIVTFHEYGGGYNEGNIQQVRDWLDGREFVMNEMHCNHQSVFDDASRDPEDWVDDDLQIALIYGRLFSIAANNGVQAWCYFLSNNPGDNDTGLLKTPWGGTPTRRKVYYAHRNFIGAPPFHPAVVPSTMAGMPSSWHAVSFHKWGDNRVFVNVVASNNTQQLTTIHLEDNNGNAVPIARVIDRETSLTRDYETRFDIVPPSPSPFYSAVIEPHSIRTFEFHIAENPGANGEPIGDTVWLRSDSAMRYVTGANDGKQTQADCASNPAAKGFQLVAAPGGDVHLADLSTGGMVRANASGTLFSDGDLGNATAFEWLPGAGATVQLRRASNNQYVRTSSSPPHTLAAIASVPSTSTSFTFSLQGGTPGAHFDVDEDSGCPGTVGITNIRAAAGSLPLLGSTFTAELTPVQPFGIQLAIFGFDDALSLNLLPFGAPGCSIDMIFAALGTLTNGFSIVSPWQIALPSDPSVLGAPVFMQALVFDPPANNLGFVSSQVGKLVVGN